MFVCFFWIKLYPNQTERKRGRLRETVATSPLSIGFKSHPPHYHGKKGGNSYRVAGFYTHVGTAFSWISTSSQPLKVVGQLIFEQLPKKPHVFFGRFIWTIIPYLKIGGKPFQQ